MTSLIVGTTLVVLMVAILAITVRGRRVAHKPLTTAARYDALNDRLRAVHDQSATRTSGLRGELETLREQPEDERLQRQADDLDRIAENRKRTEGRP